VEPSALHSQIAVFEAEDNCLFFALGLARAASEIQAALETGAQPDGRAAEEGALLYFLLGVQAFSRRYLGALEGFQAGPPPAPAESPPAGGQALPRLAIRDLLL
jgi:hypothetical protein